MSRHDETGFRHGLRVRIGGLQGPTGKLYRCKGQRGPFWKVRLTNGEWVWPDNVVVDGPGDRVLPACLGCHLHFVGVIGDLLCNRCSQDQFGTEAAREVDARDDGFLRSSRRGAYRRRSHS